MCETTITIEELRKRLTECKTLEDYQALMLDCVLSIPFFTSVQDCRAIYGIVETCAASCIDLSLSPKEHAECDAGWDWK